ncbi:MAG: hypothetical protein OEZ68_01235 [Gammaproteobacteria bacterium]|nr:hypothetical protein [Gammaproteobacteria bacterium]MDH5799403.1 hypothetical protein [Gammaproteobacteria bacterium]
MTNTHTLYPKPTHRSGLVDGAGFAAIFRVMFGVAVTLLVSACGTIEINKTHPAIAEVTPDTLTASVYFIRPMPVKPKGVADKPLKVEYNKQALLTIEEGSYTLIKIKPGQGEISTHSETRFINKAIPIKVSRKRRYTFISGRTYFIHLQRIDEEFRGIFYDPKPMELEQALTLIQTTNVTARGPARKEPIEQIESVPITPKAGSLEPAFPEGLYPQSPYLLKNPEIK